MTESRSIVRGIDGLSEAELAVFTAILGGSRNPGVIGRVVQELFGKNILPAQLSRILKKHSGEDGALDVRIANTDKRRLDYTVREGAAEEVRTLAIGLARVRLAMILKILVTLGLDDSELRAAVDDTLAARPPEAIP